MASCCDCEILGICCVREGTAAIPVSIYSSPRHCGPPSVHSVAHVHVKYHNPPLVAHPGPRSGRRRISGSYSFFWRGKSKHAQAHWRRNAFSKKTNHGEQFVLRVRYRSYATTIEGKQADVRRLVLPNPITAFLPFLPVLSSSVQPGSPPPSLSIPHPPPSFVILSCGTPPLIPYLYWPITFLPSPPSHTSISSSGLFFPPPPPPL